MKIRFLLFLMESLHNYPRKKKISPIEVKPGNYRSHSSLDKFRNKFSSKIGNSYILYTKDLMIKDGILHLPIYMAMFL